MKRIVTAAVAGALMLAGACAPYREDEFGYQRHSFLIDNAYAPAPHQLRLDRSQIVGWCDKHDGHLSFDHLGCASDDGWMIGYNCTVVRANGLPADQDAALFRWLDGICKGWRDEWTSL